MFKYLLGIGIFVDDADYIKIFIELGLFLLLFLILLVTIYKKVKRMKTILIIVAYFVAGVAASIFELNILKFALLFSGVVTCVCCLIVSTPENKFSQRNYVTNVKTPKSSITDANSKAKLIDTLVAAAVYLSSRKIGAIITIEKTQNLNTYIEKGVKLDAEVTVELLKTIFFPNTALHDGAVIIRGDRIMCAGTFYTPSDKPDINSELGSRHRAAIGISEDSDAFTVVISEESGKISTTLGGTITQGISEEALRLSLENHIIIQ